MSADKHASPWRRNGAYLAMATVIFAFPLLVGNTFHIHIAQTLLYTTIAVIGLNMLLGLSGQMSLGQAGFYAIGAYGSALLTAKLGWPIAAGMLAGILLAGLAGCLVGLIALRTRGLYLAMATLAFGFVIVEAILNLGALTRGADGLSVPVARLGAWPFASDTARYYLALAVTVVLVTGAVNLTRSRVGRAFLAIRESEIAAQASGVPVALYKTLAFGVSAFYTGVAGGLFAFLVGFLSPDAFDVFLSVDFVVMIILGGLGSVPGSIVGAAVVTVLNDALAAFQNYRPLIFGAILIACMLFMPGGITGAVRALARRVTAPSGGRSCPSSSAA